MATYLLFLIKTSFPKMKFFLFLSDQLVDLKCYKAEQLLSLKEKV